MRPTLTLAVLATLSLAACTGDALPAADAADEALRSGDHAAALEHFDKALAEAAADSPEHADLSLGRLQALAHVDSEKAKTEILGLIEGGSINPRDINRLAGDLMSAKAPVEAVTLMDAALKKFPEDENIVKLKDKLVAEAAKGEDSALNDALKGMGYLGGE